MTVLFSLTVCRILLTFDSMSEFNKLLPPLERVTLDSYGSNHVYEDFPFSIVREYLTERLDFSDERAEEIIAGIARRDTGSASL